jgi:glutamyl-tRNA synthetase/glutamyl-Q tRNA(Asp) synthetase
MRVMISRYAPAPTGFLHLGHIVNAIYVWGFTKARDGRVLLRIEDHDRQRSRPAFEAAIVEDLEWLGFRADGPMMRQSERGDIYSQALDTLRARGLVYACACSRTEILSSIAARSFEGREARGPERPALRTNDDELWYPGTCRDRGLREGPGVGLRVRLDPTVERFVDLRHGPQEQQPSEQCGDLLVRDRDGNWTYQFAATVDDYVQGVTHVIRGDDLLPSTGRQIQLARRLGRIEPPAFLHHPLIMKSPTQKLSKSDGDTGVRELRAKGWSPERVIGRAAALAGLTDCETDMSAVDVSNLFTC